MFIVCPSCSGPYRIPADQIAPLVQTACPHCEYRIILDFEAANEPSLREAGHQFAQGFESAEAYASVYDHVTSKPDAQPRLGVTAVAGQAASQAASQATGTGGNRPAAAATSPAAATPVNRPLQQRPASAPHPVATPAAVAAAATSATSGVRSSGTKTILQGPSKKPASMDPRSGDSPSLSGTGGSSMRAGRGVDVLDEQREAEAAQDQPGERRAPPHTPPTANVVSSGPPASEVPTPGRDDIAAQSGSHPSTPASNAATRGPTPAEVKPAEIKTATEVKPVKPEETKSSSMVIIIVVVLLIVAVVVVMLLNRP